MTALLGRPDPAAVGARLIDLKAHPGPQAQHERTDAQAAALAVAAAAEDRAVAEEEERRLISVRWNCCNSGTAAASNISHTGTCVHLWHAVHDRWQARTCLWFTHNIWIGQMAASQHGLSPCIASSARGQSWSWRCHTAPTG